MPAYCQEKFENGAAEQIVYWRQDKHVHNPAMQTAIARWLGAGWSPRPGSYQSNLSKTSPKAVEYTG